MTKEVIAFDDDIDKAALGLFDAERFEVTTFKIPEDNPTAFDFSDTIRDLGATVAAFRTSSKLDRDFLEANPQVHTGILFSTGTDKIDIKAATERGVAIIKAHDEHVPSVVGEAKMLIGAVARRAGEHNLRMHRGDFPKSSENSHELAGLTLAIYGYGQVGYEVGKWARSEGMKLVIYDPYSTKPCEEGEKFDSLEEILERANILTIHTLLNAETESSINAETIALMPKGSCIVNVARGAIIDEQDVVDALNRGHLAQSAHDVYVDEKSRPFNSPLRDTDKALLQPHVASSTVEAQRRIALGTGGRGKAYVENGFVKATINLLPSKPFPYAEPEEDTTRIMFLHHGDSPGAIAEAAGEFKKYNISIGMHGGNHEGDSGVTFMDFEPGVLVPEAIVGLSGLRSTIRIMLLTKEAGLREAIRQKS